MIDVHDEAQLLRQTGERITEPLLNGVERVGCLHVLEMRITLPRELLTDWSI